VNVRNLLVAVGILVLAALGWPGGSAPFGNQASVAEASGAPYLNNQYWPNWAYLPLTTLPAYNCTPYDVSGGIAAWNNTGLVSIGSPVPATDCTGTQAVVYFDAPTGHAWCSGCEGQTHNTIVPTPSRNPETGAIPYYQITSSRVDLKAGLSQLGASTVAHELGHVIGLVDQYHDDGNGDPVCSGGPASLMDFCGYAAPQQQDIDYVTWAYRRPPFPPDSFSASATAFNRVNLTWVDRSHNERLFRIERSVNSGAYQPSGTAARDAGAFGNTTTAATNNCYRIRAENDWGNVSPWVYTSLCPSTPNAVGVVGGVFSGSNISMCAGRISGSGATSYKFLTYRWSTSQAITRTISDNQSCYGAVLWQGSLASDYWHLAVAGCNSYGCSGYRDMTNPNQYWTQMPGGASGGGSGDTNYHSH